MKIAFINSVPYGSTGKIVCSIANKCISHGDETFIYYSWTKKIKKSNSNNVMIGSFFGKIIHIFFGRLLGLNGNFSFFDTIKLIRRLKKFSPDVINIHNIHCWSINFKALIRYINKYDVKVVWTFHDCWPFTGHCTHFLLKNCQKWEFGCYQCPRHKEYPSSFIDVSKSRYKMKKKLFCSIKNMTIITPSNWLNNIVKRSYFNNFPIYTINNGINLNVFKPIKTDLKNKLGLANKKIILGVSLDWGFSKGLDIFNNIVEMLPDDYQIVLIGVKRSLLNQINNKIICINRTENQEQLVEWYNIADVFLNPTREDNFPTVNLESIACGTPVITTNIGGAYEMINHKSGIILENLDLEYIVKTILLVEKCNFIREEISNLSRIYDESDKFDEYVKLFHNL